jgi:hypothetical protein
MKKFSIALSLLLLIPSSALAQSSDQFFTQPGNWLFTGEVCSGTITNCIGGSGGSSLISLISDGGTSVPSGAGNISDLPYTEGSLSQAPLGISIGHINVTCSAYTTANASAGYEAYSYTPLDATGLGGGTINFAITNTTYPISAPLVLGSVIIPSSPQFGPWITAVTSSVATPYTILPGDNVIMSITDVASTTQTVSGCMPYIGP